MGLAVIMWDRFNYSEVFPSRFAADECERIVAFHHEAEPLRSVMPQHNGSFIRDSHLFWMPRTVETGWIFDRIWDLATLYNSRYGFDLCPEIGQLQLTRYAPGQLYDWHMDLGPGPMSLRKISVIVELAAGAYEGGGIEVFYGEKAVNRILLNRGDVLIFPAFIMHRALSVTAGTRWSLVSWLLGPAPFR
jgi:PKHD-type hydroxylase